MKKKTKKRKRNNDSIFLLVLIRNTLHPIFLEMNNYLKDYLLLIYIYSTLS